MENWFRMENSSEESQSLMRLEGELNATLLFEHGGLQQASTLWVARILLGQLFRERLPLGRTVKAFAKHYQKEVMCSLVKIQDLLELDEMPLGGLSASTSSGQMRNEEMELDVEEEEHAQNTRGGQGNPREANIGLG